MKKGPNLRWSLIQCSGGDEGDRTPDLLTASQALSQLSYAPVRRSTIRELGRRCKNNFGKTSAVAAADADAGTGRECRRGNGPRSTAVPFPPAGRAPRAGAGGAARLSGSSLVAPGDLPPRNRPIYYVRPAPPDHAVLDKKPQVDGLRFSLNTGYGRGVGIKRSRWAGFVAETSRAADPRHSEVGIQATCRKKLPE